MNKSTDRILIGIMALGYLMASTVLIMVSLNWTTPVTLMESYLLYNTNRWVVGFAGTVGFILSLILLLNSTRTKQDRQAPLHETDLGQIRITIPALEHLVTKAAKSVQGVRDVKPFLRTSPTGLAIFLRAQIMPDVNIPAVTSDLQKSIKEYIQKTAGIETGEIQVLVSKVSWESKSRVE